jgi:carboxypeptidase C (cathepsin A)
MVMRTSALILELGNTLLTKFSDYNCNWLGGQVVADIINATGYSDAGFTNISTSDNIVHGQVKQAGLFSFLRIYESGHEVPFYQPLASLEIFDRALKQTDIATALMEATKHMAHQPARTERAMLQSSWRSHQAMLRTILH